MKKHEQDAAIDRYNKRLQEFGYSPKSLGWGEKDRARLRFEILLSQWDFNKASILDFGCGFGDLSNYMKFKGISEFSYTGVDINESLINTGKTQFPGIELVADNWLDNPPDRKFDFVLSSGVFNHKLENNFEFIQKSFELFNKLSTKGFACNFLSDKVDFRYDYTYHANPAEILDLAFSFSRRVVLRNDYMPFEFTVFVNKDQSIDTDFTVYSDFKQFI